LLEAAVTTAPTGRWRASSATREGVTISKSRLSTVLHKKIPLASAAT